MTKRARLTPAEQQVLAETKPLQLAQRLDEHAAELRNAPLPAQRAVGAALAAQAAVLRGEEQDARPLG
jgi:hypothetical protein